MGSKAVSKPNEMTAIIIAHPTLVEKVLIKEISSLYGQLKGLPDKKITTMRLELIARANCSVYSRINRLNHLKGLIQDILTDQE